MCKFCETIQMMYYIVVGKSIFPTPMKSGSEGARMSELNESDL